MKKCLCCNQKLKMVFPRTKYCTSCSIHNYKNYHKLGNLEYELKKLREKAKYYVSTLKVKKRNRKI